MKTSHTIQAFYISVCLCVAIGLHSGRLHAESYPDFSKAYWEDEVKNAKSKIWRGAALGAVGVASIAPTTILTIIVQPFFGYDESSGGYNVGLSAQISY
jgi:hypothetical protein